MSSPALRYASLAVNITELVLYSFHCILLDGGGLVCPMTIDVHVSILLKIVSTSLLHCEVTLFSFIINKYFVGGTM